MAGKQRKAANRRRMKELMVLFNYNAPIGKHFGMRLSYKVDGSAVIDMPYNPGLDNLIGGIHGGVYATMLDNAGWFTAAALHEIGAWVATSELSVRFLGPAVKTSLRSEGKIIKSGKRQDVVEARLYDGQKNLVGHAVATFILLPALTTKGIV
jgi:uncharacterized protein (TIGR00369 family)